MECGNLEGEVRPLLMGVSGGQTGIYLWEGQKDLQHVAASREGFSVYATALSPDGRRVVSGTKSPGGGAARGNIELRDLETAPTSGASAGGYALRFPVISVDWVNDSLIAAGTMEVWGQNARGACRFFNVEARNKLSPLEALRPDSFRHVAPIVLVKALGDDAFLTMCSAGLVRIWDLSTGAQKAEITLATSAHPLPLLPAALVLPNNQSVLVQFPSGQMRLLDRQQGWTAREVPGCPDPVGGFSCQGSRLLLNPWGSPVCRIYDYTTWESLGNYNFGGPSRGMLALSPDVVAVLYVDNTVGIWDLSKGPERIEILRPAPIRGIGGGPSPAILAHLEGESRDRADSKRLQSLRSSIESAHDLAEIRHHMQELLDAGHGFEGLVILADHCRKRNRPVAELHVRETVCRDLPEVPESAIHLRVYGDLLASMGEPERALGILERALICDPSQEGLESQIAELKALPKEDSSADNVYMVSREEGRLSETCERAYDLILRDAAVDRDPPRCYTIEIKSGVTLGQTSGGDLDLEALSVRLEKVLPGRVGVIQRRFLSESNMTGTKEAAILYVPNVSGGAPIDGIAYLCLFSHTGGHLEYNLCVLVDPSNVESAAAGLADTCLARWSCLKRDLEDQDAPLSKRMVELEEELYLLAPQLLQQSTTEPVNTEVDEDEYL